MARRSASGSLESRQVPIEPLRELPGGENGLRVGQGGERRLVGLPLLARGRRDGLVNLTRGAPHLGPRCGPPEKGRILDEFVAVTGFHRNHAMRVLRAGSSERRTRRVRNGASMTRPSARR